MEVPGLGDLTKDEEYNWWHSEPIPVKALGGLFCTITLEDYEDDPEKEDFHTAIKNFLSTSEFVLEEAEQHIYEYYKDMNENWQPGDEEYLVISAAEDVWSHIQLGDNPTFIRNKGADNEIYISLECNCDWEVEHGLQIVFKNGLEVNKIGPFDGHLTNSKNCPEDVIYERF